MRKCAYCKSVFVCWNWFFQTKEKLQEFNPTLNIKNDEWGHECWKCNGVQISSSKVKNGLPYWLLKFIFKYFIKHEYKELL